MIPSIHNFDLDIASGIRGGEKFFFFLLEPACTLSASSFFLSFYRGFAAVAPLAPLSAQCHPSRMRGAAYSSSPPFSSLFT